MKFDMRDAFFLTLLTEARTNDSIIVISGDHGAFALEQFAKELPHQYFNVGIAEQNMISVSAGLALAGKIPFVYGIAPFLILRALEQITLDICANSLPVNLVGVGAGFTYSTDGPTHHGLQDLAVASSIPGLTILNSSDPANTSDFVRQAIANPKPHYIRIEKEKLQDFDRSDSFEHSMEAGFSKVTSIDESTVAMVSSGVMSHLAVDVAEKIRANSSKQVSVFDVHRVAPFPKSLVQELRRYSSVYVLEDSYQSVIARELLLAAQLAGDHLPLRKVIDAADTFYFQGDSRDSMHDLAGLSAGKVLDIINFAEEEL